MDFIFLLDGDVVLRRKIRLTGLKTRRLSSEKRATAESLPSVLGMDFLYSQKMNLHYFAEDQIAYLEI
jgi:hypothetical protein